MSTAPDQGVTRIVIVDGHDLYRLGLARYLESEVDLRVLAHAPSGTSGLRLIRQLRPDVVVLDEGLPDIQVADILHSPSSDRLHSPSSDREPPRVVILTAAMSALAVTAALATGASSYLGKDNGVDEVAAAIRAAAAGNSWLCAEAATIVSAHLRETPVLASPTGAADRLSSRELDVLKLLTQGLDNSEIATALSITPSTAKNHVSNILTKLETSNRILAATYAIRNGLA